MECHLARAMFVACLVGLVHLFALSVDEIEYIRAAYEVRSASVPIVSKIR